MSILMVFISLFRFQIIFQIKNFVKKISHLHYRLNDLKNEMILSPLAIDLNDESKDILSRSDNLILIKNRFIKYRDIKGKNINNFNIKNKKTEDLFNNKAKLSLKNILRNNKNSTWKIKTDLNGLTMNDIVILKELSEKKYIEDNFFIKITISFAPAIFLSIVYSIIFGDLLMLMLKLCMILA
ncbi:hypothetical protein [Methanobrevibacter curvatus]|nr:hypothetical protein [Methanobrevibacter curvatus]